MMTNDELIATLKTAAETQDNIALKMLLLMAAERIDKLQDQVSEDFIFGIKL